MGAIKQLGIDLIVDPSLRDPEPQKEPSEDSYLEGPLDSI